MGGKSSKGSSGRDYSFSRSANSSSSWNQYGYQQASPYPYPSGQQHSYYTPQNPYAQPPFSSYGYEPDRPQPQRRLERKYSRIADNYQSLDQVTVALAQAGLESSNLIVGIDFTKTISIIGSTLSAFDEDIKVPCFGFGNESICNGFEELLSRYKEIVPQLRLAGPTTFAPIIEMAITIVEQSGGQYHVLLIIANGQVTRSIDTLHGQLSPQEKKTIDAIVKASNTLYR
ncbi:hypothetical protein K2173_014273 [Erythroxylum novogranatense]|uniref:Copine C-terminal domain-containing protein n=1 Tax=Erythroxylum novogranatense TaxID=1862640 RepID=A0AAV8SDW7_9ROSI|nr:hypothetical protein K2173_014273 [Erythroxylum novogranatense]